MVCGMEGTVMSWFSDPAFGMKTALVGYDDAKLSGSWDIAYMIDVVVRAVLAESLWLD